MINFFIHSGTAQAALTMPIMAPLADLVGITRQTMVYAYQLCELVNPILPTSAVTMGVLGMARIPWEKWAALVPAADVGALRAQFPAVDSAGADELGAVLKRGPGPHRGDQLTGGLLRAALATLLAAAPAPLGAEVAATSWMPEDWRQLERPIAYDELRDFPDRRRRPGRGHRLGRRRVRRSVARSTWSSSRSTPGARGGRPRGSSSTRSSTATRSRARTRCST